MSKKKVVLGVDIGGTKIATGAVDFDFRIVHRAEVPTLAHEASETILQQVCQCIDEVIRLGNYSSEDLTGIGVLAPGPTNPVTGVLFESPNIPAWRNIPLADILKEHYHLPTLTENDANAAGLAEVLSGAAVGCKYVLYVTVSTGIGTGIIIENRIYHGRMGLAAEGGHVKINYQGPLCSCGQHGCIEAYASGPSLARRAREKIAARAPLRSKMRDLVNDDLEKITPITISHAASQGDKLALELIRETGEYLGMWLGGMVNVLDPDIIVLGGGVSHIGPLLFQPILETMPKFSINPFAHEIPIVPAKFETDVGILGGAALHLVLLAKQNKE